MKRDWMYISWLNISKMRLNTYKIRIHASQGTKTSLGRPQGVWNRPQRLRTKPDVLKTSGRRSRIYDGLKTSDLPRLEDVRFITSWIRLIYDVLKTSDLRRLKDIRFSTFWRHLIYDVLKTFDLRLLDDLCKTTSVEEATSTRRQKKLFFLILYCLKYSEISGKATPVN